MKTIGHWINGEHVTAPGASTSPVFNPATGAEQAQLQLATVEQVNDVVAAAKAAWATWVESSLSQRSKILFAFREIIALRSDIDETLQIGSKFVAQLFGCIAEEQMAHGSYELDYGFYERFADEHEVRRLKDYFQE